MSHSFFILYFLFRQSMCPLSSELFNYARFNDLNVLLKLLFYLMATCHQFNASLYSALFPFSLRIFATMRLIPLGYLKIQNEYFNTTRRVFHVRISSTTYPLITNVVSEAGSAETRPRPRHGYPRPRHRHCETETRPRHGYP